MFGLYDLDLDFYSSSNIHTLHAYPDYMSLTVGHGKFWLYSRNSIFHPDLHNRMYMYCVSKLYKYDLDLAFFLLPKYHFFQHILATFCLFCYLLLLYSTQKHYFLICLYNMWKRGISRAVKITHRAIFSHFMANIQTNYKMFFVRGGNLVQTYSLSFNFSKCIGLVMMHIHAKYEVSRSRDIKVTSV